MPTVQIKPFRLRPSDSATFQFSVKVFSWSALVWGGGGRAKTSFLLPGPEPPLSSPAEGLRRDLLVGKDLEGGIRSENHKSSSRQHRECQQWSYMWQPWRCISCVAVHRVGLPLGRTASPRFRDKQWTVGRKPRPVRLYPVTADRIVTSRPTPIDAHGHRQCRCLSSLLRAVVWAHRNLVRTRGMRTEEPAADRTNRGVATLFWRC